MPGNDITLRLVAQDLASGQISKAIGSIDKLAQRGGIAGSVIQGVGLSFGYMLNPMMVAGRALGSVTDYMGNAVQAASDMVESQSKVGEVFDVTADDVLDWADDLDTAYGISKQAALEAVGTFGNFGQALGLTEKAAADMSTQLVELAGDLGSFNNVARDEVLVALRSGLAGETEPMRRLGVDISAARIQALGLAEGLVKTGEKLTEAQKVTLRYKAIMQDTSKAQGDAVRTADTLAGSERTLAAETENLSAKIGEQLLPYQKAWNEALLETLSLVSDIGKLGSEAALDLPKTEAEARVAFEDLASDIGVSYDELAARVIAASGRGARTFVQIMSDVEVVGRDVLQLSIEQNQEWRRAQNYMPLVSRALDDISDSGDDVADSFDEAADRVKAFRRNLEDYDDIRSVDKVQDAIDRTRKALNRAVKEENWAAVARRKARLEQLRDERDVSQAAEDGAEAWARAKNKEKRASDEMQREVSSDIATIDDDLTALGNVTAKPTIQLRDLASADLDALRRKLDTWRDSVTTIRVNAGITYDPITGQTRSTTNKPHTGGVIGPGETAIVRQNEALVTPAAKTAVVPLDGPGAPAFPRNGGNTIHVNFAGAYIIGSADKLAQEIGPALARWMRN